MQTDTTPPTGSVNIPSYTNTSTITATVTDTGGSGMYRVGVAVWFEATDASDNEQDDLVWYYVTSSTSTYSKTINFADHSPGTEGEYNVHIYAWDNAGNGVFIGGKSLIIYDTTAPTIINLEELKEYTNESSITLSLNITDNLSGINEVKFYAWTGEGDYRTERTVTLENDVATTTYTFDEIVDASTNSASGAEGIYHITVEASNVTITLQDNLSGMGYWGVTKNMAAPSATVSEETTIGTELKKWYLVSNTTQKITVTFTNLSAGTYYVWAKDLADNIEKANKVKNLVLILQFGTG